VLRRFRFSTGRGRRDSIQLTTRPSLCTPRQATFSRQRAETVAEIADLATLDAKKFFAETHITEGMGTLLRQVFQRLTGQSDQGVYRLKQAMGGGKTHNLLAAALLARDPDMRKVVLSGMGMSVDNRTIRVSAFSGRETDMREYLWERIFHDLGRESHWTRTSQEPGPSTWTNVVGDEPALILLDELPPYFVSLANRPGGPQGSEADRLAIALANLMNAILSNKLPNCCLVISDLSGAWAEGSSRVQQAIDNASREVTRSVMDVVPVRLDSTELYGILRSKLFEKVAGDGERRAVGQEYATALRTATQQGAVPGAYERWAQEVAECYPFHPGLHELFARFRENKDFQQTRETLRLAQRVVAGAWSGRPALADTAMLLHPHMIDLADADTASTFERINPALNNARTRDIATVGGSGVAQKLAESLGDETAADAAKLIFWSMPIASRTR
jgi:predicted AAA+ superfamily ATPase